MTLRSELRAAPHALDVVRLLGASAVAAAVLVAIAYCAQAWALAQYPWDWSPDEGLFLDYARRLLEAPATLHGKSFVPFPSTYGPVLPVMLAPALVLHGNALGTARLLALGWTLLGAAAAFLLVRRSAPPAAAIAAAALTLTPFDLTFWHLLIRPDGLQQTLWLLAAAALMPRALSPQADRLSLTRLVLGTVLVLTAILTKATAVVLCAPLVLGWFLVERRSALRLCLTLGLAGLLVLAALQWATAGGFLWATRVWALHTWQPSLPLTVVERFVASAWPILLLCLLAFLVVGRVSACLKDGAVLLLMGAVAMLPLTAKHGAWWNYLLPVLPAVVILGARLWAGQGRPLGRMPPATAAAGAFALLALTLAATRSFPLPTSSDTKTAGALYGFIARQAAEGGGPILAIRPEMAYFVAHQPVEMEGSCYLDLASSRAPGTEVVHERLRRAVYSLVVVAWPWELSDDDMTAVGASYRISGVCAVAYFYGPSVVTVLTRSESWRPLPVPPGARCGPTTADALSVHGR